MLTTRRKPAKNTSGDQERVTAAKPKAITRHVTVTQEPSTSTGFTFTLVSLMAAPYAAAWLRMRSSSSGRSTAARSASTAHSGHGLAVATSSGSAIQDFTVR